MSQFPSRSPITPIDITYYSPNSQNDCLAGREVTNDCLGALRVFPGKFSCLFNEALGYLVQVLYSCREIKTNKVT